MKLSVAVIAGLLLLLSASPMACASHVLIAFTPYHGLPGTFVHILGSGFLAGPMDCWPNVTFTPQPFEMPTNSTQGYCNIDPGGVLTGNFTVRLNAVAGTYTFKLNGTILATFVVDGIVVTTTTTASSGEALRGSWDNQTVTVLLDRGNYLPNDTVHATLTARGNFSNIMWLYVTIENETSDILYEYYWQPNQTNLIQSKLLSWAVPSDAYCGYYTFSVDWDHRVSSVDFYVNALCMPIPEYPFSSCLVLLASVAAVCVLPKRRVIGQ